MTASRPRTLLVAALAACVLLMFAGQSLADATLPRGLDAATGRTLGQAGFAFVGGLRTFAAASLWNRLDPQLHDYYGGVPLEKQLYMVPSLHLITLLDPQFENAYFVLPWIVANNGRVSEGLRLAADGLRQNPRSGKLAAAYAQLLFIFPHDLKAATAAADRALSKQAIWSGPGDEWTGLSTIAGIYRAAGETAKADQAVARAKVLEQLMKAQGISPVSEEH